MKKLLFILFLSTPCYGAQAVKYVQISTGALQAGTTAGFNVSSGTVVVLNVTTMTAKGSIDYINLRRNGVLVSSVTSAGEIIQPLQPSFVVYLSADANNVTGDGTNYTVVWDTEIRDAGSDFNNATGVFTAPVDGQYAFSAMPNIGGLLSGHTSIIVELVTSNATYVSRFVTGTNPLTNFAPAYSWIVDMDTADTASIIIIVSGGTKVVDIGGSSNRQSSFFGSLIN